MERTDPVWRLSCWAAAWWQEILPVSQMDQMDLTGPFAVLSRLPNSSFQLLWKNAKPVSDMHGLVLTPDATFADAKSIDLLVMTGGAGQEALMEDEEVLSFVSQQVRRAKCVFSICTGALVFGSGGTLERPGGDELLANFSVTEIFLAPCRQIREW